MESTAKKNYAPPEMNFILFNSRDILATSTPIFEVEPDAGEWDNEM